MDTCGWSRRSSGATVFLLLLLVLLGATCDSAPQVVFSEPDKWEGDTCGDTGLEGGGPGICQSASQCPQVLAFPTRVRCGANDANVYCCPQTSNTGIEVALEIDGVPPPQPINITIPGAASGEGELPMFDVFRSEIAAPRTSQ
ncbi:unnamed protein product [Meganyctiphanes norvegica]|uniref:Uncharacterized protein n=1 Tax=Meganyctiphanes norvegica TaxID=48144 RepID=A0AAV2PJA9_MEGNR